MKEEELILEALSFILKYIEGSLLASHSQKGILQARSLLSEVEQAKRKLKRQKTDGPDIGDDPSWDYYD